MKELVIYFGKQNDSPLGWGGTADTIRCEVPENFDIATLTSTKWASVKLPNGYKYINTENILWADLIDKENKQGGEDGSK